MPDTCIFPQRTTDLGHAPERRRTDATKVAWAYPSRIRRRAARQRASQIVNSPRLNIHSNMVGLTLDREQVYDMGLTDRS